MAGSLYFGQFLLSENVVTREQLLGAVEHQRRSHLRLGDYAVRSRELSKNDVRAVTAYQERHNMRFGDAAVALGLLTREQVERLLRRQRSDRVLLGEAFVELGHITREVLRIQLARFERAALSLEESSASVPSLVPMADVADSLFVLSRCMLATGWGMEVQMGYAQLAAGRLPLKDVNARVIFSGGIDTQYYVGVPRSLATIGARHLLRTSDARAELLVDLVREYANMVAGAFVARSAVRGHECGFTCPSHFDRGVVDLEGSAALWMPLLAQGEHIVVAMTIGSSKPIPGPLQK